MPMANPPSSDGPEPSSDAPEPADGEAESSAGKQPEPMTSIQQFESPNEAAEAQFMADQRSVEQARSKVPRPESLTTTFGHAANCFMPARQSAQPASPRSSSMPACSRMKVTSA